MLHPAIIDDIRRREREEKRPQERIELPLDGPVNDEECADKTEPGQERGIFVFDI